MQTRDSVRRDLEVALQSLSFLERFGEGLDSQRRLFVDFPRVTEELRTGAMERLAGAMEHLYEGGQNALDLSRFLRDLPLALGHLAQAEFAAHRQKLQQAAAANKSARAAEGTGANHPAAAAEGTSAEVAYADGSGDSQAATGDANTANASADAGHEGAAHESGESSGAATGAAESDSSATAAASETAPAPTEATASNSGAAAASGDEKPAAEAAAKGEAVSPRVELRSRLLAAAPQLNKAAQAYRRNASTVRRAAAPRRAVGPWRSDREVLDQARRAIEFANKVYDAYAEAWNDAPLAKNAGPEAAAEMDRFLAWTQLSRYAEVARTQSTSTSAKTHEAAPGVKTDKASASQPPPPKHDAAPATDAPANSETPADASAPADSTDAAPAETTTEAAQ